MTRDAFGFGQDFPNEDGLGDHADGEKQEAVSGADRFCGGGDEEALRNHGGHEPVGETAFESRRIMERQRVLAGSGGRIRDEDLRTVLFVGADNVRPRLSDFAVFEIFLVKDDRLLRRRLLRAALRRELGPFPGKR